MTKAKRLRLVSFLMLAAAVVFVLCALSNPQLGSVVWFGPVRFGAEQWWVCYAAYAAVMVGTFLASFFVKKR